MLVAEIHNNRQLSVVEREAPPLPEGGALVRLTGCGFCGSDLDKLVNQKAAPGSVLGHEVTGVIETLAPDHEEAGFRVGDRIVTSHHVPCGSCHYCLNNSESMCRTFKQSNLSPGGFSQLIGLTAGHLKHTAFKIPDGISDAEAACVEPLACTLRAVKRGGETINGSTAIIGLGFIGMMAAQLYRNRGDHVIGFDLAANRLQLATAEGFVNAAFHPADTRTASRYLDDNTETGGVDRVFLTVVNPKTLELALSLVRDGGNLILFTSAACETAIDPTALYFRELNLITSYSPSLSDLKEAAGIIFQRQISVSPLVTHHLTLDRINEAVALYQSGEAIKVLITNEATAS